MFTCKKCGKKAKTSYERVFGDKPAFEPVGFYCHTCGIFYDAKSRHASKVVYGVAKNDVGGIRSTVAASGQERIRTLHKPYTKSSSNVYENESAIIGRLPNSMHENQWMGRDSNSRPPACKAGILTRLDNPSKTLVSSAARY